MTALRFIYRPLVGLMVAGVIISNLVATQPHPVHSQTPAPQKIESDDGRVSQAGTWLSQSADAASGGRYLYNVGAGLRPAQSTEAGASEPRPYTSALLLQFSGPSLEVIYVSGPSLGTLAIEVDGTVLRTVITMDTETRYGQSAKIDYLTDEVHELKVYAQGGGIVAVDAFVVDAAEVGPPSPAQPPPDLMLSESNATQANRLFFPIADCPFPDDIFSVSQMLSQDVQALGNITPDGRYLSFATGTTQPTSGLIDLQTCRWATFGESGGSFSPDGRFFVHFVIESLCCEFPPRQHCRLYLHDWQTGLDTFLSWCGDYDFTADSRYLMLLGVPATATDYDPSFPTPDPDDLTIYDTEMGSFTSLVLDADGPRGFGGDFSISGDGRYYVYVRYSLQLVRNVYVYDTQTQTETPASVSSNEVLGNGASLASEISSNGRYVVFYSDASNLVTGDTNGVRDIFVRDLQTGTTTRVSVSSTGGQSNGLSEAPSISDDGRFIVYSSDASNLVPFDTNGVRDIFLYDQLTGTTRRVSAGRNQGNAPSEFGKISGDGHTVMFMSRATNLTVNDTDSRVGLHVVRNYLAQPPITPTTDTLALFRPDANVVTLIRSGLTPPPLGAYETFTTNPPADATNGRWMMGDWDGDGSKTPGVYANSGAFYYTNSNGVNATWQSVWIGLLGRPPVAGRFDAGVNHDCIGVVDSGEFPPYGTAFALYFTCDLTNNTAPTLTFQWLSVVLPDSGGFSGTHQFAAGDFNNNGVDSIAIRRGEFIAFTNVPPTTLLSEFNLAQYWGVPPVTSGGYGVFLAGDFDNTTGDSFGVFYQNGNFYYRNAVDWSPGPHTLQQVGQPIGTPVQATSWR